MVSLPNMISNPTAYVRLARPHQYLKNVFVLAPLFFGGRLTDLTVLLHSLAMAVAFCLAASTVYVFNDIKDVEADRNHPTKRKRPLAAGLVSRGQARVFGFILGGSCLALAAVSFNGRATTTLLLYIALNLTYSLWLKKLAIVDITCIAIGFVLRVWAGGQAAEVPVSMWLVLMTFLLALFIALSKRRDDLLLAAQEIKTRQAINGYNLEFISLSMTVMAAVVIVSYILYTVNPAVEAKHHSQGLYLTTFWVILGLLRYMQITFVEQRTGSPTSVFAKDLFLQTIGAGWVVSFLLILYIF